MAERKSIGEMTDRELLILLNERMNTLEKEVTTITSMQDKFNILNIRLVQLETKVKIWASVIGFGSGILSSIISKHIL